MTPFGVVASIGGGKFRERLTRFYPGIDGEDPARRAQATCDFFHDFILDGTPLSTTKPRIQMEQRSSSERGPIAAIHPTAVQRVNSLSSLHLAIKAALTAHLLTLVHFRRRKSGRRASCWFKSCHSALITVPPT